MKLSFICYLTLTLALSAFSLPLNQSEEEEWNAFKSKYGKNYTTKEVDQLRKYIYFGNKLLVLENNHLHASGVNTYKLGLNKFADLTSTEFRKLMMSDEGEENINVEFYVAEDPLPSSVDWRDKGAVTPVKDQDYEKCKSSWAFSATGSIEGQHFIKNKKIVSLSEQQLMDCPSENGTDPCNGGTVESAFESVKIKGGIDTEESYPYEAEMDICRYKDKTIGAKVTGYKQVRRNNEIDLQAAVAKIGPISVAIDASSIEFQLYSGGIFESKSCSYYNTYHHVLVVGYGTEKGKDYWLVKNSFGTEWGEKGYIRIVRNGENNCGITRNPIYPFVSEP